MIRLAKFIIFVVLGFVTMPLLLVFALSTIVAMAGYMVWEESYLSGITKSQRKNY